jgi:HAMP domain-containing protein
VVVLTVIVVAYLLATRITHPIRVLKSALAQLRQGNLNHRIKSERNDEFGLLFGEYNRMAEALLEDQESRQQKLAKAREQLSQTPPGEIKEEQSVTPQTTLEQDLEAQSSQDDATRIFQPKIKPSEVPGS